MSNAQDELVWKAEYSVGHPVMDRHHSELLEICNRLHKIGTRTTEATEGEINSLLTDLYLYAKVHFKTEEALLREAHYPKLQEQVDSHANYTKQLKEFRAAIELGTLKLDAMSDFISRWWLDHILHEDIEYRGQLGGS